MHADVTYLPCNACFNQGVINTHGFGRKEVLIESYIEQEHCEGRYLPNELHSVFPIVFCYFNIKYIFGAFPQPIFFTLHANHTRRHNTY